MRDLEVVPAWVARQRNRFRDRRSDEKIVRWINYRSIDKRHTTDSRSQGEVGAVSSGNDNVMPFTGGRLLKAYGASFT